MNTEESAGRQPRSALIIDDSLLVQARLKQLLRQRGFEIAGVTATGAEGVAQAQALQPGLIMLDHQLPDGFGDEFARQARAAGVAVAIIAVTGTLTPELASQFMDAGVDYVLAKPIDPDQLTAALAVCGFSPLSADNATAS